MLSIGDVVLVIDSKLSMYGQIGIVFSKRQDKNTYGISCLSTNSTYWLNSKQITCVPDTNLIVPYSKGDRVIVTTKYSSQYGHVATVYNDSKQLAPIVEFENGNRIQFHNDCLAPVN